MLILIYALWAEIISVLYSMTIPDKKTRSHCDCYDKNSALTVKNCHMEIYRMWKRIDLKRRNVHGQSIFLEKMTSRVSREVD